MNSEIGRWPSLKHCRPFVFFIVAFALLILGPAARAQTDFGPGLGGVIPDNNATGVSSTITVGASTDVILGFNSVTITNLTHSWMSDLTATISNGTTTVSLFARPGDSSDFGGTYTFAAGGLSLGAAATAAGATDAIPSGTYAPLQSLSAFNNAPITGNWVLKITDTAAQDVGSFSGWSFNATVGQPPPLETYNSASSSTNILDASLDIATGTITPGITISDIVVSDTFTIGDLAGITIDGLNHTLAGDLTIQLQHLETGTSVDVVNRLGRLGAADNFDFGDDSNFNGRYRFRDAGDSLLAAAQQGNTAYDIPAGTYARSSTLYPEGLDADTFKAFLGESVSGTWRLRIVDNSPGDIGSFLRWGFTASAVVPEPSAIALLAGPAGLLLILRRKKSSGSNDAPATERKTR